MGSQFPPATKKAAPQATTKAISKDLSGDTDLHGAVIAGELERVKSLVGPEALEARDEKGRTPLHLAICYGHAEIVKFLALHPQGKDVWCMSHRDADGKTPIIDFVNGTSIAASEKAEILKLLLSLPGGSDAMAARTDGRTPLQCAILGGKPRCAEVLIAHALASKDRSCLTSVLQTIQNCMDAALRSKKSETGGLLFLEGIRLDVTKQVLEAGGPDLLLVQDELGDALLHTFARLGDLKMVELLVEYAGQEMMAISNSQGDLPLHDAARNGHVAIVKLLVEHPAGASTTTKANGHGSTALTLAALNGQLEVSKFLATHPSGACTVTTADMNGNTPLHLAAHEGHLDIVKLLVEVAGSKAIASLNHKGETALYKAAAEGHVEAVKHMIGRASTETIIAKDQEGCNLAHLAAMRDDVDLLFVLLRKVDMEGQTQLFTAKNSRSHTAMDIARAEKKTQLVQLLWGEGVGAGEAIGQALSEDRNVVQVAWQTQPIRGSSIGLHSFIVVTVKSQEVDAQESYVIEKCNLPEENGVLVSFWDAALQTENVHLIAELDTVKIAGASLRMATLVTVAKSTGPYAGSSNCHHAARAVFNACALPAFARTELPNPWLNHGAAILDALGIPAGKVHSLGATSTASQSVELLASACLTLKDIAQEEAYKQAEAIGEGLADAAAEDIPVIRVLVKAAKKVHERFQARSEVTKAIEDLYAELEFLCNNMPEDETSRRTLQEALGTAVKKLESPALRYVRRPEDAAREVQDIAKYIKDKRADVMWQLAVANDKRQHKSEQETEPPTAPAPTEVPLRPKQPSCCVIA